MGVIDTLDGLSKALQSPAKLGTIGGMAADLIRGHIHQGSPGWSPLAPATVAYRGEGKPLQDTGGLRDSITFSYVDGRTVSVGTNKPYAKIQNNGGVIRAKKNWLWIPAAGTRQLQRRYGYSPTEVLRGLKAEGYSVFRKGRTMCYRRKGGKKTAKPKVAYYLKKSVEIPARPFFYLTPEETALIMKEVGLGLEIEQL
jgi:phage gpG-like protein